MKIIRYFLLTCIILSGGKNLSAQNLKASEDPGQFMVQIRKLMDGSKNPVYIRSTAQLDSIWMSSVSSPQQNKFISIVKTQFTKGQKAGPVLHLLIKNTTTLVKGQGDVDGFLDLAAKSGDKYDAKTLQRILETIKNTVETNKLYTSNFNSLYLLSGSYKFRFDTTSAAVVEAQKIQATDNWDTPVDSNLVIAPKSNPLPPVSGAVIDLQNAVFGMVATGDSVAFGPTTGSISLKDGVFAGKGGKFNWQTAGDSSI